MSGPVESTLANDLRLALTKFMETGASDVEYWNNIVKPIIKEMVSKGGNIAINSTKTAIAATGEYAFVNGEVCYAADVSTELLIQRTAMRWGLQAAQGAFGCANIIGFMLFIAAPAGADVGSKECYKKYLNKYLSYLLRAGQMGGHQLQNMPPPMGFQKWTTCIENRNDNAGWWQNY